MNKYFISLCAGVSLTLVAGCQVVSGERTVNQYSSDAAITANVKTELLHDPKVTSLPIHVDTDKGTVFLSGFVKTNEQKMAAAHAAIQAKGVQLVSNNIIVRP